MSRGRPFDSLKCESLEVERVVYTAKESQPGPREGFCIMDQMGMICAAAVLAACAARKAKELPPLLYRRVLYCALVTGLAAGFAAVVPGS